MSVSSHLSKVRILYKTILRLHRGLPTDLQPLGNNYARDEFRRHMKCTPEEAQIFMTTWADYCVQLARQLSGKAIKNKQKIGTAMTPQQLEHLRDEQVIQIYELFKATKGIDEDSDEKTETSEAK